jgi:hypothetical protein
MRPRLLTGAACIGYVVLTLVTSPIVAGWRMLRDARTGLTVQVDEMMAGIDALIDQYEREAGG